MSDKSSETSRTDWDRLDALEDDDIDYSDIPPLDDAFFAEAAWRLPGGDEAVILPLEHDVVAWFRAQGEDYLRRMSAVLKSHKEACESA